MKAIKHLLIIALVTVFTFSCKTEEPTYAKAEFKIAGMTCPMGCAKTIEKKVAKMEGVKSATVDFDRQLAMVEYDDAKVTPASLEKTVTSVAETFKVSDMKTVKAFSTAKKECTMKCKADCTKANCADCASKTDECKKKCASKTKAEKMACAKDCKKACCTEAKKA